MVHCIRRPDVLFGANEPDVLYLVPLSATLRLQVLATLNFDFLDRLCSPHVGRAYFGADLGTAVEWQMIVLVELLI